MCDSKSIKKRIRSEIINKRNTLSKDELIKASIVLNDCLSNDLLYQESEIILGYASYGSEIPTFLFLQHVISDAKQLYLPKVIDSEMIFFKVDSLDKLINGYKGIMEPVGDTDAFVKDSSNKALLLMPGVAFDNQGNRIGYGGGFYDKFLEDKPILRNRSVAFAFDFQKVDSIPAMAFDLKPARIIYI